MYGNRNGHMLFSENMVASVDSVKLPAFFKRLIRSLSFMFHLLIKDSMARAIRVIKRGLKNRKNIGTEMYLHHFLREKPGKSGGYLRIFLPRRARHVGYCEMLMLC